MPYCRKCGNELAESAKFCSLCGAPVAAQAVEGTVRRAQPRPTASSEIAKIAAICIVGVIVIGLVIGFLPTIFHAGQEFGQTVNPPSVAITSRSIRTGNVGLDYYAWVDVSVHNDGGPGTVVVWAEVSQGSNSWKKSQSIYLESQGSRDLTLTFSEVGFWTFSDIYYRVWVER
jgi:hypothetical protein